MVPPTSAARSTSAASSSKRTGSKIIHVPFEEVMQTYFAILNGDLDWAYRIMCAIGPLRLAHSLPGVSGGLN